MRRLMRAMVCCPGSRVLLMIELYQARRAFLGPDGHRAAAMRASISPMGPAARGAVASH